MAEPNPTPPQNEPTPSDRIVNEPAPEPTPEPTRKKLETRISELEQALAQHKITLADYEKKLAKLLEVPAVKTVWQQLEDFFN